MDLTGLDHVVIYAEDVPALSAFYARVLGGERFEYGPGWWSVRFDGWQLNFRPADADFELVGRRPTAGAADICIEAAEPLEAVVETLDGHDVELTVGPVDREGARGEMTSVYFTDPEGNLVEIAEY